METTISPTLIAEHANTVLNLIRRDIAEGQYEAGAVLDGYMVLHDYVDANDYVLEATGWMPFEDSEWDYFHAICDLVDTLLHEQPITV